MKTSSLPKVSLGDYEEAVAAMLSQLELLYRYNGGEESARVVEFLLKQVHRRTPWLAGLVSRFKAYDSEGSLAPIEQVTGGKKDGEN